MKKNSIRVLAWILVVFTIISTFPVSVFAETGSDIQVISDLEETEDDDALDDSDTSDAEAQDGDNSESGVAEQAAVESYVAKVGDEEYTDIQEAIKAAAPSGTVELLSNVTVDKWITISETLTIGDGSIIALKMEGLTIDGKGHTITIEEIESPEREDFLFHNATELNVKDLTIKCIGSDAYDGGISLKSGTISNVTFEGGKYGVLPGVDGVTITGCTFNDTKSYAIYFEEERPGIVVTGNTFNTADGAYAITMRSNEQFTGNTIIKGRVNLANSAKSTVSGNNFGTERFKVYNGATATISNNTINNLVFNDTTEVKSTFAADNNLGTDAQGALAASKTYGKVAKIGETYYVTLAEAVAAAESKATILLMNGEYELPLFSNKELTFEGETKDGVIINDAPDARAQGWLGSTFHFENLTAKGATANYHGLANGVVAVTYKDCVIKGLRFLYAENVSFEDCAFNAEGVEHSFWTYSASNVTVTNCTFTYTDRAVNCYSENGANHEVDITFSGCTFTYAGTSATPEGAVEINSGSVKSIDLTMNGCTAPANGAMWFNSKWDSNKGQNTVVTVDGVAVWKPLQGSGTAEDPILINNLADLILFRDTVNTYTQDGSNQFKGKYVKLTADIDLAGINWTPIGTNSVGDHAAFMGIFDGDGHTIANLYINADGGHLGFFARVGSYEEGITPTVKNIKFHNVDISTNVTNHWTTGHGDYVGGVIANAGGNSVVSDITVTGNVYIDGCAYVGGIVGHGYPDINKCVVNANDGSYIHSGYWCAGGIIGFAGEGGTPITNSSVSGLDIWSAYGAAAAIAGLLQDGNKIENVSASNVEITSNSDYCMGYIAGNGEASTLTNVTIENVTATANGQPITATDAVAKVDSATYFSLQAAIDAVQEGETIVLLRNVVLEGQNINGWYEGIYYEGDKSFTLDLGGHSITCADTVNDYAFNIKNLGTKANEITIKNGTITGGTAVWSVLCVGNSAELYPTTVTLESVTVNAGTNSEWGDMAVKVRGTSIVNVKSGTEIVGQSGTTYVVAAEGNATLNIYDGSLITACAKDAPAVSGNGTINIYGGTITATNGAFAVYTYSSGTPVVNISGGTITGDVYAHADVVNYPTAVATVNISGGTFNGKLVESYYSNGTPATECSKVSVSGGTFDQDPSAYLADGYIAIEGADGWTVKEKTFIKNDTSKTAVIYNLKGLKMFRDEVNDGTAFQGWTITLDADIDLGSEEWTPISTFNGVFDGADHTISNLVINGGSKSDQGFFGMTQNGEIKNLTFNNAKVSGRLNVGVVAGTPYTSKYTNITVTGHVEVNGMSYVGGVGGKNAYANWTDITVDVDSDSYVKATSTENGIAYRTYVGGIVGFNGEGSHTFKNISSNIRVIGDVCDIGGLFGIAHYGNNFENVTFAGSVTNTNTNAEDAAETGAIAGVWHNQKGYTVTFTGITIADGATVTTGTNTVPASEAIMGAAYHASNETPSTSGSLIIDGKEAWLAVAKIGDARYATLAEALAAAKDGETITLVWAEGDDPIAMNGTVFGKSVTITGTATVDWSKGWLYVGRGGEGNGTVIFDNANLTSASNSSSYGIHVSGREKNTNNKYDGTLIIKNSTIELDYLINRGTIEVDNSTFTVKNGFGIAGRPATETESGEAATATITIKSGSYVKVLNHNGMGIGRAATVKEGYGILNLIDSTFECNNFNVDSELGDFNVSGVSTVKVNALSGKNIDIEAGTTLKDSTIGGSINMLGDLTIDGGLTLTGGLWVGKSGETLTATLSGNKLTAGYFMFQRGTYTINADIDAGYGYLSFEGTFEVNSTIHTTGANGEVLYINGNVTLNNGAVLDSDNSVFLSNEKAVLTLKPGSKVDSNINFTNAGAKLIIDATDLNAGEYANITGTVTGAGDDSIKLVGNNKLYFKVENGKICLVSYVAMIGEIGYTSLADAIAAVGADKVAIELLTDATLDYTAREAYGATDTISLTIKGNGHTLTLNQKNSDWASIGLANANAKLVLNDMTINKNVAPGNGAWNNHAIIFSCNVEMNNVIVNNGIAVQNGATLNNVTINEAGDYYGLWINGNGQSVTMNGGAINATKGRGIKIADQYIDAPASVTLAVTGTEFNTAKKAAVLVSSTAGAKITALNVDITNVKTDSTNFAWVDEDWAESFGNVTVNNAPAAQESATKFGIAIVDSNDNVIGYYQTLKDAIEAATEGATIKLLVNVAENVTVNKKLTINLNGKTITSAVSTIVVDGGELTITGDGKIVTTDPSTDYDSAYEAIAVKNNGKLILNGGSVEAKIYGIYVYSSGGTVEMKGGSVVSETYRAIVVGNGKATISGGSVSGIVHAYTNYGGSVEITGGTFSALPDAAYVAYEYAIEQISGTTNYQVVKLDAPVASVNGVEYYTIAAAIAAANDGDVVTVAPGVYYGNLSINKKITLMAAASTFRAVAGKPVTVNGTLSITADGTTVSGMKFVSDGTTLYINAKDVTIDNCEFIGGWSAMYQSYTTGRVKFTNSTFTALDDAYAIHFDGSAGGEIEIDNCVITGWTSFAVSIKTVTVKDTTFAESEYNNNVLRFYQENIVIEGCTFNKKMSIDLEVPAKVTVKNSTFEGGNITDLFSDEEIKDCIITVGDEVLGRAAKIGETYYDTLQDAINACVAGDNTIELVAASNENVTIKQVEGVNVTIDGNGKKYSGTITIHGNARYEGAETLTIQNFKFVTDEADHYFIDSNSTGSVERYAHNVTVKDSTFTATGEAVNSAAAMRIRQGYNIAISNVTATGMHSLLQAYGNAGITVTYVTVNGKNGIAVGTSTGVTITNANITATGYGVRADGEGAYDMTVEDSTIEANDPIVVRKNTADGYQLTLKSNTLTSRNANGYQVVFTSGDDGTYDVPKVTATITGAEYTNLFGYTAKIGSIDYATLADAFAAAQSGETIVLLQNITLSETIKVKVNATKTRTNNTGITLDLNGKTITGTDNATGSFALIEIQPGAELTIADSIGTGKITLKSANNRNWNAFSSVVSVQRGKLTVDGGTIEHLGGTDMAYAIDILTNTGAENAETVINGGTIKSTYRAIRQFANSAKADNILTVNGGTIEGTNKSIWLQGANAENNPAKLTVDEDADLKGYVYISTAEGTKDWKIEVSIAAAALNNGSTVTTKNVPAQYAIALNSAGVWGKVAAVAKINGVGYASLEDAFAAAQDGDEIVIFVAGTYKVPTGKDITITGEVAGVVFECGQNNIGMNGASVTFNNVIFNWAANGWPYHGLAHCGEMVYNDCIFNGTVFLYGTSETFNNCIFNVSGDTYNVWTYGAKEVVFNECIFNSAGKSVLIYAEGASIYNKVTVKDSTFKASAAVDGKAAIEMDSSLTAGIELNITNSTATGFGTGNVSDNSLWNNKKGNNTDANNDITVVVGGETVLAPVTFVAKIGEIGYTSLANAFAAVGSGDVVIELLTDATLDYGAREAYGLEETTSITINGNGNTLTLNQTNSDWSSVGMKNADGKLIINNATIEKTGKGDTSGAWNTHAIIFSCDVALTDVTVNNAIAVAKNATLTDVTINEANGYYGLWIEANGQTVTMTGGEINATNGGRGIKIADQYVNAPASVTLSVTDTDFNTAEKAAVLVSSTAGAAITATNVDITNVAKDSTNFVWVDEDWAADFGKVTVNDAPAAQESASDFTVAIVDENGDVRGYYKTLQAAINACKAGDNIIKLLADNAEDVTIKQVEGVYVTIDGNGKTYSGTITIHGNARYEGAETLTIQNFKFESDEASHYFIDSNSTGSVERYAHNVTVKNSTFTATGAAVHTAVAMRIRQGFDIAIENVTTNGLHSVLQGYGIAGVTVKTLTATNMKNGISLGTSTGVTIENATIVAQGYGVRADGNAKSGASGATITNSNIMAVQPIIVRNLTGTYDLTVIGGGLVATGDNEFAVIMTKGDDSEALAVPEGAYKVTLTNVTGKVYPDSTYVAEVNGTKYANLADAIAAASAGDTITFLADIAEDVTIDKNLTIDGASFKYTGTMTGNAGLTITVQNVDFVNGGFAKTNKSSTGTYIIKDCAFDGDGTYYYPLVFKGANKVTVENCTVKDYLYSFLYITSGTDTVSVKNVTVEDCPNYAIYFASGVNKATIENLTVKNSDNGFLINNTADRVFTIKNCKMENVVNAIAEANGTNTITCTVLGDENDFGTAAVSQYAKLVLATADATLAAVAHLNVTTDATSTDENSFYAVAYENGTYIVKKHRYVAEVNGVKYEKLADAIAKASAGNTITLLGDVTENVTINKSLTIDGANFKYTGGINVSGSTTDITVKNVNFVDYTDEYAITTNTIKSITVENCTLNGYDGFLYANRSTPTVVVKNVTMNGGIYGIHWVYGTTATLENVTMTNVTDGLLIQNYASKTINLKNCDIASISIWERSGSSGVQTFKFEGNNTVGTLSASQYAKYVLAAVGATLTAPEGATVTTTVADYNVEYKNGAYVLVPKNYVAQIGEKKFESLAEAIAAAQSGDTITMIANHTMDGSVVVKDTDLAYDNLIVINGKELTIDFNGYTVVVTPEFVSDGSDNGIANTLESVIFLEHGANLTLMGNGGFKVNKGTGLYSLIYNCASTLTIKSGSYFVEELVISGSIVYADEAKEQKTTVDGGTFMLGNAAQDSANTKPWIFNVEGKNQGSVYVNGGTFNQNILMNDGSAKDCEVKLKNGTCLYLYEGNGTWTVKDHTVVTDAAVDATCTATGLTEGSHCSNCGEVFVEQTVVAKLAHTVVVDVAKAPTCTETGLTAGAHCSVCNEVLVAQEVVAALGHTEEIIPAVAPTFENVGYTEGKKCSVCGEILVAPTEVPKRTDPVAQIGTTKYATLEEAIAAAQNGDTVVLLRDTTANGIIIGKEVAVKITIDLDGHTLSYTDKVLTVYRYGTEVTIVNGTISGNSSGGTIAVTYGGKAILGEGITITSAGGDAIELGGGTLEIGEGATVIGAINCMETAGTTANTITITGGNFTGNIVINEQSTCVITGGTFDMDVTEWCADEYVAKDNKDGTWTVEHEMTAKIITGAGGEIYYATLSEAIAAAQTGVGARIILLKDYHEASIFMVPAGVTLDLNSHKITVGVAIVAFGSIIDTATQVGGIQIASDGVVHLRVDNGAYTGDDGKDYFYMPLYDSVYGGYKFFSCRTTVQRDISNISKGILKLGYDIKFSNTEAYALLAAGGTKFHVNSTLTWQGNTDSSLVFTFADSAIADYGANRTSNVNYRLTLTITGLEKIAGKELTVDTKLYSDTLVSSTKQITYTHPVAAPAVAAE